MRVESSNGVPFQIDDEDLPIFHAHTWCVVISGSAPRVVTNVKIPGHPKTLHMPRLLLRAPPGMLVDHKNGDTLDNRRANLRLATKAQNTQNARHRIGKTGLRGVHPQRGTRHFIASVSFNNRQRIRHGFRSAIEAAYYRDLIVIDLHGAFGVLNFPCLTGGVR